MGSKICISLDELLCGIYTLLIEQDKDVEITRETLYEYENEVARYLEERGCELFIDNSKEKIIELKNYYKDIKFFEDKIIIPGGIMFRTVNPVNTLKLEALYCDEARKIILSEEDKKLTLSYR